MTGFYISEDFPTSEIEFEKRFRSDKACYDYFFKVSFRETCVGRIFFDDHGRDIPAACGRDESNGHNVG